MYVRIYYFLQIANKIQSQLIFTDSWTSKRSLSINISNSVGHLFWSSLVVCGSRKHVTCVLGSISLLAPYTVENLPKGDDFFFLFYEEDPKLMSKFSFNTSRFCILQ